jgi:hypothetical protein
LTWRRNLVIVVFHCDKQKSEHLTVRPEGVTQVPCGRKRKRHKIATHKRKKKLRKNRHKKK